MATPENPPAPVRSLSLDQGFELLSHRLRRSILACLFKQSPLALADLAAEVARREQDAPISEIPDEEIQRIYVLLWHVHVPKLADADVVEHTHDTNVVALAANADQIRRVLAATTHVCEEAT